MYPQRIGEAIRKLEETQTREYADKKTGAFLLINGFINKSKYFYLSDKCSVEIGVDGFIVSDGHGMMFSEGYNIYWLIGLLTYRRLIDKNYKQ